MFNETKYCKWYFNIIEKAKTRILNDYKEKHHIFPKSLGGTDSKDNIVELTAKEHYVVHHLLTKMCVKHEDTIKMWNAFFLMHIHNLSNRYYSSRTYELSKMKMAEGKKLLVGVKNHFFGKKHSEESKSKMKVKRKDRECRVDNKIYTFTHDTHGEYICRRIDLMKLFCLNHKLLHKLVKGTAKSVHGWKLKKEG